MNKDKLLLFICLFFSFLVSMNIWFSWGGNYRYINMVLAIVMVYVFIQGEIQWNINKTNITAFILLAIGYLGWGNAYFQFIDVFNIISVLVTYFVILCLKENDKELCIKKITTWFAYLLLPSVLLYFITSFVSIPSFGTIQADSKYLPYDNYILLVKSPFYVFRFSGPFLEPGHLGMMISFLLLANQYDFRKWEVIFLTLVNLLTFSLAGYVLSAIGYFFVSVIQHRITFKRIAFIIVLLFGFYQFSVHYNNGDNVFNKKIIERLQFDKKKGIVGNNRVYGNIDKYYQALFKNNDALWNGYDAAKISSWKKSGSDGTGYKIFLIKHGIIGLFVTSLFYLYVIFKCNRYNRKYAFLFFVFIILAFIQRCYPYWTSWIMCYVFGIATYQNIALRKLIASHLPLYEH